MQNNNKLKLKTSSIKAVIFDMDGVLIDSEYWWPKWQKKFLAEQLGRWNKERQQKIIGRSLKDIHKVLQDKYNLAMSWRNFQDAYNQAASDIYQKQCQLMPGVYDVLDFLIKNNINLALSSSSFRSWIKMALDRFKLNMYFDTVVSAEDVDSRGKPAPDIYLYTARKLKVKPKQCLVIEDSKNGILAANAAGMIAIGYQTKFNRRQDLQEADKVVRNLGEIKKILCQSPLLTTARQICVVWRTRSKKSAPNTQSATIRQLSKKRRK